MQAEQADQLEHSAGVVDTSPPSESADDLWFAEVHAKAEAREWHNSLGQAAAMIDNAVSELESRVAQVPKSQGDRVLFEMEAAYRHLEYAIGALPPVEMVVTEGPPF